ncbi:DNA uptake protein [Bibersteinia trehalosi USDA-ARS-USMARC-190]|uniref:DNA uptake protein n=1 Tax=Bibersteinia trehalosi USDA-ARS-USMARC-190 TaxID=1263832 RepID=W0R851_BIBTR|nr:helix-hairpin-helix domain-containing protein [Bibersteinia trehalosi]AHG87274.1 DNA uptake protein [Bibersteinia trehalosi USDA-ARS-USMARC-190]
MKKYLRIALSSLVAFCTLSALAQTQGEATHTEPVAIEQVAQAQVQNVNLVNLNTATAAEIQDKLVGIGAKKAQAIVEYREKNGNFISLEQLTEVSGIGKATLDKNRDRLVLE